MSGIGASMTWYVQEGSVVRHKIVRHSGQFGFCFLYDVRAEVWITLDVFKVVIEIVECLSLTRLVAQVVRRANVL